MTIVVRISICIMGDQITQTNVSFDFSLQTRQALQQSHRLSIETGSWIKTLYVFVCSPFTSATL